MEINLLGTIIICSVVLIVSLLIIKFIGYEVKIEFTEVVKEVIDDVYSMFLGGNYNICESYDNEYISIKDFETLLVAYSNKQCENTKISVILSFQLTRDDISEISRNLEIAKSGELIIYDRQEPLGAGAIIVNGNYSEYLFKTNDLVEMWDDGYPEKDVILNLTGTDCKDGACLPRETEHDRWGCPITKDITEGNECECNRKCKDNLVCYKIDGVSREPDGIIGHCCPQGEIWDGNKCEFQYTFTILFMQLKEEDEEFAPIDNFEEKARIGKDNWVRLTPLNNCGDKVGMIVEDRYCEVPDQELICNSLTGDSAFAETTQNILDCIKEWGYNSIYTRVEGIIPGENVCCIGEGCIGGYTGGYNYPLVSSEDNIRFVTSHEMGHTFGLCDEAYGGGTCTGQLLNTCKSKYCSPVGGGMGCIPGSNCCPNKPEMNSIMCTSPETCNRENECSYSENFASTSYGHLEKELGEFCE